MTNNSKREKIGYQVFNYTDNIYASAEPLFTKKEAKVFIKKFRNRYNKQGYYRNNRLEQINPKHIDLEIIPADFNPFGKSNQLSFEEFCRHFGISKPDNYTPIVDAYIQYQFDFTHGGYVSPDNYFQKGKNRLP